MKAVQNPVTWKNFAAQAARVSGQSPRGMEHRWGHRRPCRARVSVCAGADVTSSGQLRDVSMSGAFIETTLPLPLFAQIAVAVLRGDARGKVEFTATVVRRQADGVGIEWLEAAEGPVCRMLGCAAECALAHGEHG